MVKKFSIVAEDLVSVLSSHMVAVLTSSGTRHTWKHNMYIDDLKIEAKF